MKSFGIDLGTTNCALAFASVNEEEETTEFGTFDIPQLVESGQIDSCATLPSFIYLPASHELSAMDLALPWDEVNLTAVGRLARQEGSKKPDRLISSYFHWLIKSDKTIMSSMIQE